jgi:hypothetical protein
MFVVTPLMAAILLGSTFWTGVAATAAIHNGGLGTNMAVSATSTDHEAACSARYHSYNSDPDYPDQWLGRDGQWHVCTL